MKQRILRSLLALVALLSCAIAAHAVVEPAGGRADNRIREVRYDPNNITRIVGYIGITTQVFLGKDEKIVRLGPPGNKEVWDVVQVVGEGATFTIRPVSKLGEVASSNLLVQTDQRLYVFELTLGMSQGRLEKPSAADMMFVVRFCYDDCAAQRPSKAPAKEAPEPPSPSVREINRYTGQGDQALRPFAIYDDGVFTYIRFTAEQGVPAVYYVGINGEEGIPNRHIQTDQSTGYRVMVYHGVWSQLRLRYDEKNFYCVVRVDPIRSPPPQPTGVPLSSKERRAP